jgi:hypothetical protein
MKFELVNNLSKVKAFEVGKAYIHTNGIVVWCLKSEGQTESTFEGIAFNVALPAPTFWPKSEFIEFKGTFRMSF